MQKIFWIILVVLLLAGPAFSQEQTSQEFPYAGEFFGVTVLKQNYDFAKKIVSIFGNPWGQPPEDADELEDLVWEHLLFSYEAYRNNITVSNEEVDVEVRRMLKQERLDKGAYTKLVKDKYNEPLEVFENQTRQILEIKKLRETVMQSVQPQVTEEEAHQEFINVKTSLSLEAVGFADQKAAEDFYNKAKAEKGFWESEKKTRPGDFKNSGLISLQSLINTWRIPQGEANKIIQAARNETLAPIPTENGFIVAILLEKKAADEAEYAKAKYAYYEALKEKKKIAGLNEWIRMVKQQAKIRIFKKGG